MPDSIFRHENRCLFHGSNFIPSPIIMTKLWNCEEQQSLCHLPNMWGVRRGGGPILNTWSHIVHSHDHPITERCNPNYSPTQRFYISPQMHWAANLKDQENCNWGHYIPAYPQTDRPNDQPTSIFADNSASNMQIVYANRHSPSLMEMEG